MYLIGVFRRTALWCIIFTVLGSIAISADLLNLLGIIIVVYAFILLLDLLVCEIRDKSGSIVELSLSMLGADLAAPFSKFSTFLAVITGRWVIQDDSKFHSTGYQWRNLVDNRLWSRCIFTGKYYPVEYKNLQCPLLGARARRARLDGNGTIRKPKQIKQKIKQRNQKKERIFRKRKYFRRIFFALFCNQKNEAPSKL